MPSARERVLNSQRPGISRVDMESCMEMAVTRTAEALEIDAVATKEADSRCNRLFSAMAIRDFSENLARLVQETPAAGRLKTHG